MGQTHRVRGAIAGLAIVGLVVAGCGSDDGGSGEEAVESTTDAADTAPSTDGEAAGDDSTGDENATDESSNDDMGDAVSGAVVTVDGETFTFDQEIVCIALGGAVGGTFASTTDDISFDVMLPPEDWESRPASEEWSAPSVRLDDDRADVPVSWRAGGEVVDGMNGIPPEVEVTSFAIGGESGSGAATVVEINRVGIDDPVLAEMTFEFGCG